MERLEITKTKYGYELRRIVPQRGTSVFKKEILSEDSLTIRRFLRECATDIKGSETGLDFIRLSLKGRQLYLRNDYDFFEETLVKRLVRHAKEVEEKLEVLEFREPKQTLLSKRNIALLTGSLLLVTVAAAGIANRLRETEEETLSTVTETMLELESESTTDSVEPKYVFVTKEVVTEYPSDFDRIQGALPAFGSIPDSKELAVVKENYLSYAEKWGSTMGIDPEFLCCVMAQERVRHSATPDPQGTYGIMQILDSVWLNEDISYYDVETETWESYKITESVLESLDGNIKTGTAILQQYIYKNQNNIFLALQEYNFGAKKVGEALSYYYEDTGKTLEDVRKDAADIEWIPYCKMVKNNRGTQYGDPDYVANVLRRYSEDKLDFMTKDQKVVTLNSIPKQKMEYQTLSVPNPEYIESVTNYRSK